MIPSTDKELEQLLAEFTAAQAAEARALKQVDSTLDHECKDMHQLQKVAVEMLQAHSKSMDAYFKLLRHKLHPPPLTRIADHVTAFTLLWSRRRMMLRFFLPAPLNGP